ncbi:MAG: UDP-glucose dehydrogenase family protein [Candidatus Heimdallarchaeota archaeon]
MTKAIKQVSLVGLGFVGLTTAAFFASRGISVTGIDIDAEKIQKIRKASLPFYEENLEPLLKKTIQTGFLRLTTAYDPAIAETDMTMIAVGTPSDAQGQIDLKYIKTAAHSIGQVLKQKEGWHLVIVKSTVIPGTTRKVVGKIISEESGKVIGRDFGLCSNPEFLREGSALKDTMNPDRVVIGEYDDKSGRMLKAFYETIYSEQTKILRHDLETAEMVKYVANSFLALKISFANEIANICEQIPGMDVCEVMKGVTSDFRINPNFFGAGLGFGGSCLPKDVSALLKFAKEQGYSAPLLHGILQVNNHQPQHVVKIVETVLGGLQDKKIAILGLAFKKNTDDMREAPSIQLVKQLHEKGASQIFVTDPKAEKEAKRIFHNTVNYGSVEECLSEAAACILVTDWPEYTNISPKTLQSLMVEPRLLLDGRRIFDPSSYDRSVTYRGIGLSDTSKL